MTVTAWICKNENCNDILVFEKKPIRNVISDEKFKKRPYCLHGEWLHSERLTQLETYINKYNIFADITWADDPVEIEITIKRKLQ